MRKRSYRLYGDAIAHTLVVGPSSTSTATYSNILKAMLPKMVLGIVRFHDWQNYSTAASPKRHVAKLYDLRGHLYSGQVQDCRRYTRQLPLSQHNLCSNPQACFPIRQPIRQPSRACSYHHLLLLPRTHRSLGLSPCSQETSYSLAMPAATKTRRHCGA